MDLQSEVTQSLVTILQNCSECTTVKILNKNAYYAVLADKF